MKMTSAMTELLQRFRLHPSRTPYRALLCCPAQRGGWCAISTPTARAASLGDGGRHGRTLDICDVLPAVLVRASFLSS